jgi:hypothetical protein
MPRGYRDERDSGKWLWVLVKKETAKAWLCYDGEKDHWIPKSQILDSAEDIGIGVAVKIEVKAWIADQNEYNVDNDQADVMQRELPLREPAFKIDDENPI